MTVAYIYGWTRAQADHHQQDNHRIMMINVRQQKEQAERMGSDDADEDFVYI